MIFAGGYSKFDNAFVNTQREPGNIALAFYSGIYSYAGWNYLNFMTEELRDPYRNLPRAIYISLPVVTVLYILANISYLAVLDPTAMLASNAIAVVCISTFLSFEGIILITIFFRHLLKSLLPMARVLSCASWWPFRLSAASVATS